MKIPHKILASAAAMAAAASVIVSGLFTGPADIVKSGDIHNSPPAVIRMADEMPDADIYIAAEDEEDDDEDKKKHPFRRLLMMLPAPVRGLVCIPLWGIGTALTSAAAVTRNSVLSPAAGTLLTWLLTAALVLASVIFTLKTIFPDIPLKKLVTKRNIGIAVIGTLIIGLIGSVLPLFLPDAEKYERIVKFAAGLIIITASVISFRLQLHRKEVLL